MLIFFEFFSKSLVCLVSEVSRIGSDPLVPVSLSVFTIVSVMSFVSYLIVVGLVSLVYSPSGVFSVGEYGGGGYHWEGSGIGG